ncbi:MAG: MtnX-like HAD-IB family phosphatase [bacterium]|nr:MtnX-like HAD-IB family phosphatase [bacterium]
MKKICIISDFDGTITEKDSLFGFFEKYADKKWLQVEQDWIDGKISSKECLIKELDLIYNLSEKLIDEYLSDIKVDKTFVDFYNYLRGKNIDFFVVSDGIDYFINKILVKSGLKDIKILSNHGEFIGKKFVLSFPNDNPKCINNAGTCKCGIVTQKRTNYEKIIYLGDGTSDFCVADKVDFLFAKTKLFDYCQKNNIQAFSFKNFKDIDISSLL